MFIGKYLQCLICIVKPCDSCHRCETLKASSSTELLSTNKFSTGGYFSTIPSRLTSFLISTPMGGCKTLPVDSIRYQLGVFHTCAFPQSIVRFSSDARARHRAGGTCGIGAQNEFLVLLFSHSKQKRNQTSVVKSYPILQHFTGTTPPLNSGRP